MIFVGKASFFRLRFGNYLKKCYNRNEMIIINLLFKIEKEYEKGWFYQ